MKYILNKKKIIAPKNEELRNNRFVVAIVIVELLILSIDTY